MAEASADFEGVPSILDTDLYKITMQCAVLKNFPDANVTYELTNRTPDMRLTRKAYNWCRDQILGLKRIRLQPEERAFLRDNVKGLTRDYLDFLENFRFDPEREIDFGFVHIEGKEGSDEETGDITLHIHGLWSRTILYEIPLLALVSEAYFKFVDTDWNLDGQKEKAKAKALELIKSGCVFSEFGTRRRRNYSTQVLVMEGLLEAAKETANAGYAGRFFGTSNVHLAHLFKTSAIGTVAHEWTMGIAAYTQDYTKANELGLYYWTKTFTPGILSIALTDTFGTEDFLKAFAKPCPFLPGTHLTEEVRTSEPSLLTRNPDGEFRSAYAELWEGVRQDSGDPAEFVKKVRKFYDELGVKQKKSIVFSDSLNVELCRKYKQLADEAGFDTFFGVGTFLTNDFTHASDPNKKSKPMNIVIKISSVNGNPAVKISDDLGKNTGDATTVEKVKRELGYIEKEGWNVDESSRWGK